MIEDGSVTEECVTCGASLTMYVREDGAAIVQWATLLSFIAGHANCVAEEDEE